MFDKYRVYFLGYRLNYYEIFWILSYKYENKKVANIERLKFLIQFIQLVVSFYESFFQKSLQLCSESGELDL